LKVERRGRRWGLERRHLWYKVAKNATWHRLANKAVRPTPATRPIRESALFDGNREPRDQPRHLVQIAGIMIP